MLNSWSCYIGSFGRGAGRPGESILVSYAQRRRLGCPSRLRVNPQADVMTM